MTDSCELLEFLESRNPFSDNYSFGSIATGINAGISVNVDTAKDVGEKILTSMAQQNVLQHSNEPIQIDPQLLFQWLITAGTGNVQLDEIFQFELCSYPPTIFEARYVMRPADKPALADAIWVLMPKYVVEPTGQSQYVLDGGFLVHRIPLQRDTTYSVHYVGSTQTTSPEDMDMSLSCSTGTRKNYPRNMVLMNSAQVEEQAQQLISRRIWSSSFRQITYDRRPPSLD